MNFKCNLISIEREPFPKLEDFRFQDTDYWTIEIECKELEERTGWDKFYLSPFGIEKFAIHYEYFKNHIYAFNHKFIRNAHTKKGEKYEHCGNIWVFEQRTQAQAFIKYVMEPLLIHSKKAFARLDAGEERVKFIIWEDVMEKL